MQNTFFSSSFSRNCNGYTYTSQDRFCGHSYYGYGYVSQLPVCSIPSSSLQSCCACCANANSSMCTVPVAPLYLCGLRQSTLIQYGPCKRVIFNGLDSVVTRLSGLGVGRRTSYEKGCGVRESRKGWGKGRYRCMVYEDSGDELDIGDEAEVMLSLLTEEVGEECLGVRRRNGRRRRKVIVEERGDGACTDHCVTCGSKKKVGSGIPRSRLKFEYDSAVNKENDEVDRIEERREEEKKELLRRGHQRVSGRREDKYELLRGRRIENEIDRPEERREEEDRVLLRRGHQRVFDRREDKDELLRGESRKKEREGILIENHRQRAKKENKDDLSRREKHEQGLRKDLSSCTSYYSLSSMGEYEGNSGIQESQDEFEEGLRSKYKRNSGKLEEIEIDEKAERHDGYQDEQRLVLKKGKRVDNGDLWQKESEKKLTIMSTEETGLRKESDFHEDVSYKKYEGQEEKATSMVKSNEGRREQRRRTSDEVKQKTETIKNYKQFKEHSEGYTQSSNTRKLDIRKTSSSGLISGTTQNNQENSPSTVLSSVHDAKEKHYHHGKFSTQIDSRKTSRRLTEEDDIQRATISQRQSEHNIQKQEESSSSVYGSLHEPIKKIKNDEGVGKSESKITMEKITNSGRNDADQRSRRKYDSVITPPSSEREPRGSLQAGSTSGLVIGEVGHDSSREDFQHETSGGYRRDETYGQPLGYPTHEDALGSADLLQKSSSYHVGEFMDKVRLEMSSSEFQKETKTHETKTKHDLKQCEEQAAAEVVSEASQLKGQHSSPSSGSTGPSVEMWDVDEPPNQEHPGAEVLDGNTVDNVNTVDSVIAKRSSRSLWNVMSDVVRFAWAPRSTNQSQMSKTGGKNSPNQSTSSGTLFLGTEPDENIQEGDKKRKGSISQESISAKITKEVKSPGASEGGSSSSFSSKDQVQPFDGKAPSYTEVPPRGASSGSNMPSLGGRTSHKKSEVIVSNASMEAGSSQSPAMRLRRSPYIIGESSVSGKVDSSVGGEIVQTELPVSTGVSEISQREGKDEQQKSRQLQRTTQVVKDRFEEWEEAYRIEAEQRKTDEMFMREALVEARKAADSWEVPVGAVLVHDGKIIARGHNLVEELRDSTAHAEMICIREASKILRTWRLSETTLYVTLEPCAMCAGAILQARVDAIVWGAPNKLLGADGSWVRLFPNGDGENSTNRSDKAAAPVHPFHPNIEIRRNILASECADSMKQFFQRRRKKEKKQEPPKSRIPVLNHPSKFLSKMHDAFHIMFCL